MSSIRTTRSVKAEGSGTGPTLAELRQFLDQTKDWKPDTKVTLYQHESRDQREGSSWRLTLTEGL